jgi:ParB family chromosome partitioning protein
LIATTLRLLKLPDDIQKLIEEGKLSAGHGRALLLTDDLTVQRRVARAVIERSMSVRETERAVKHAKAGSPQPAENKHVSSTTDPNVAAAETKLRRQLSTGVSIKKNPKGNGGRIEIEYYTDADLDRIYQILMQQK